MDRASFAGYLATLSEPDLVRLLEARPDVLAEPHPRGFDQLAQRLDGPESLIAALLVLDRDAVRTGGAIAALQRGATVPGLAALLAAGQDAVAAAVADLCARGLAWTSDAGVVRLVDRLHGHFSGEIGPARPAVKIAQSMRVAELAAALATLGRDPEGLRKPELIAELAGALADPRTLATTIARLPPAARKALDDHLHGSSEYYYPGYRPAGEPDPDDILVAAGLLVRTGYTPEAPREVAVAAWLAGFDGPGGGLTGRPEPSYPEVDPTRVRAGARAAAREAVRIVTMLLDEARDKPIVALKRGGIGTRERARLAKRMSVAEADLPLWLDVGYAAGLLGAVGAGYAPTSDYRRWREEEPSRQWAVLASAWLTLTHAPTSRDIDDDREIPPPLPLASTAGVLRRAVLAAAVGGASVAGRADEIDFFCPLHGYDPERLTAKVGAARREAELLGVVAADVVSDLGEHLLATAGIDVDGLADRCREALPEASCTVIVQSDLTIVVSGQPSASLARLLAAAAVAEARGVAGTWRLTPASVRAALDSGWDPDRLLGELRELSARPLPQPVEYLVNDVARRHGRIRVRGMRSCVVADEATATEILHTRSLGKLHLARVAPTVLSSPMELDKVLAALRDAGFAPMAEDATGAVILPESKEHEAAGRPDGPTRPRPTGGTGAGVLAPIELARRLAADPGGGTEPVSGTARALAGMNRRLDDAELALLADAVDRCRDITIAYRDKQGGRTVRRIRPTQLYGRWLDSWCHLRNDQRDFAVANIESVSPAID